MAHNTKKAIRARVRVLFVRSGGLANGEKHSNEIINENTWGIYRTLSAAPSALQS